MDDANQDIRKLFHDVNNWLSKITVLVGQNRFRLEEKGIDASKLEEEKEKMISVMDDVETYSLKICEILKDLKKKVA